MKTVRSNRQLTLRRGISLLEVILAIGILGASIAALSSVVMVGTAAATDAKYRALAQMLCEQQMAQLLINTNVAPISISDQPLPSPDPTINFSSSVMVQQAPLNGMLLVQVSVTGFAADGYGAPVTVSLVRWMIDPNLGLEQLEADEAAAEEEAAASSSSSTTSSSGASSEGEM